METLISSMIVTLLVYLTVVIVSVIFFIKKAPKYVVAEDGIFVDDLSCAINIPNNTIKSVKLIDKLPKIIAKNSATKWKNIRRGNFMVKLDNGVKESLLLIEDYTKCPVIELVTTSNLIYINLGDEEMTRNLFNEITEKVKIVAADELVVYKDKRTQKMLWIITGIISVATGLFTFVIHNLLG